MNYQETLEFLFNSLPMYQRVGRAAYKANLNNTLKLDEWLGHPHHAFRSVHVAGTNGKGSVSHMLASVLQQAGFRTGLYTSPHLLDFRERIRINGVPIPEAEVTGFVDRIGPILRELKPSFFEMTVAMAFDHFAREKVDVAIIETGLGGRLDSTNIISPVLSIITNVSRDHTEFLGSELHSIAKEKGGIIKKQTPVVIGKVNGTIGKLYREMAGELSAPIWFSTRHYEPSFITQDPEGKALFRIRNLENDSLETIKCDLTGTYQQENLITALTALGKLRSLGWDIPSGAQSDGLAGVVENTGLLGRWQTIGHNPRSICDTAHNEAGIAAVMQQIMQLPRKSLHMVWGMVTGKETDAIFPLLPRECRYYFTRANVPRSMEPEILLELASRHGLNGTLHATVEEAYSAARRMAGPDDLIFTGGSTFVVADLLKATGYG